MGHLELQSNSVNVSINQKLHLLKAFQINTNFLTPLLCSGWKDHSPQSFILSVLVADSIMSGHSYGVWCVGTQVRDCVGDCECGIETVSIAEYERPSVRITVLNGVVEVISSSDLRCGP